MHPKMRFPMAKPDQDLPRLLDNLHTFSMTQEVRGIARQGNATGLDLQVTVLRPPAGSQDTCPQGNAGAAGWKQVVTRPLAQLTSTDAQFNDCLAFTLKNRDSSKQWYGYVLNIDPNFQINQVWPTARMRQDDARIEGGNTLKVDDAFYRLDIAGKETLLFVASEQQIELSGLTGGGMRGGGLGTPNDIMAKIRASAVGTRSVETAAKSGPWGAQSIVLDVTPPR
jgi:hypothetical protein